MQARPKPGTRRGAIAPLAAVLSLFLVGMVAFAVDFSWIVTTKSELQNAADAAALAGANKLMDYYVQYQVESQKQSPSESQKQSIMSAAFADARTTAKTYAGYNGAGGLASLVLADADVELGFLDGKGDYKALASSGTTFPNSVTVVLRRDGTSNGELKLFFAPALGTTSIAVTATARATIYGGVMNGYGTPIPDNAGLLPMTYDVKDWEAFLKSGKSEVQVYSTVGPEKGNFGLLGLDDEHAGTSEVRDWINNGLPPAGVQTLIDRKLIPVDAVQGEWDWLGNTGFRSSVVQDVNAYAGKTFTLPLFQALQYGNNYQAGSDDGGANKSFNIIGFVGVRIVASSDPNRDIVIEPAPMVEVNAAFKTGTYGPAGTYTKDLVTTFHPAKLTN